MSISPFLLKGDMLMIKQLISKLPDDTACITLLTRFEPLLKKYSALLTYEDAFEDLRAFFIELINKMANHEIALKSDGQIVNYIVISIQNYYIHLSKSHSFTPTLFSELSDEQLVHLDSITANEFDFTLSEYFIGNTGLKKREIEILYMYYVQQFTVKEIARHFNISRQAVNQTKLRAIEKLKKTLIN